MADGAAASAMLLANVPLYRLAALEVLEGIAALLRPP